MALLGALREQQQVAAPMLRQLEQELEALEAAITDAI